VPALRKDIYEGCPYNSRVAYTFLYLICATIFLEVRDFDFCVLPFDFLLKLSRQNCRAGFPLLLIPFWEASPPPRRALPK
jgi:hypothetical protein